MAEKKYVVPVGGLEAAMAATKNITTGQWAILRDGLEAFCAWISNNTIGPTASQARELIGPMVVLNETSLIFAIEAWQRRCFLAPESELCPIEKALRDSRVTISNDWLCPECERVHEAIVPEPAPEPEVTTDALSHLVRAGRTLCGLTEWEAGNVDIKFGVEKRIATCLECLREIALESFSAHAEPEPELDPLIMYIMRHFEDIGMDPRELRNRVEAAKYDYGEHVKRNAKEESAYWRVTKAMGAVTLSREEGDKIIEYVRGAIHDSGIASGMSGEPVNMEPFKPTRFDGATRIVNGINEPIPNEVPFEETSPYRHYKYPVKPEQEVPEEIKDIWLSERAPNFYVGSKEYNGALLEAFRRGQKAAFSSEKCSTTTVNYSIKCKRPCTRWIYRDGADWPVCDECGSPNLPDVPAVDPLAEVDEEIKDLLYEATNPHESERILKAFRRGHKSTK